MNMNKVMTNSRLINALLWVLILYGVSLRLHHFGDVPSSLNRDEAALGYNAYTLSCCGVDEWGREWPFLFESFGDFKLPGYIYGLVPLIKWFGVHDWVIRLPALLAGLGLLYLTYLISYELTKNKQTSLFATAVMAVSPWAVYYARMAWEAYVALFWLGGVILLIMKPFAVRRLVGILIMYSLSVLTYNTPLLLAPVLVVFVWFVNRLFSTASNKNVIRDNLLKSGVIIVVAVAMFIALKPLIEQKQGITIFSDPTIAAEQAERYMNSHSLWQKMLNHRLTNFGRISLINGLKSVGPKFLVFDGGSHPWHSIPGRGHIMLTVYLMMVVSIGQVLVTFFDRQKSRSNKVCHKQYAVTILMLMAFLPAVVTVDAPHATRSLLSLWLMVVVASVGISKLGKLVPILIVGLMIESVLFGYAYFDWMPKNMHPSWPRGMQEAVVASKNMALDGEVYVTNGPDSNVDVQADQMYIYALLYSKTRPENFQATVKYMPKGNAGLIRVAGFENMVFESDSSNVPSGVLVIERNEKGEYELRK